MAKRFGKWRIQKNLPEGGQAYIYVVVDSDAELPGEFILKRLKNPRRLNRFVRELDLCRSLDHPRILRVIDADLTDASPYIVYPYCKAGTLATSNLSDLTLLDRLRLFGHICEGMAYAHSRVVIHRDLKPENIFVDSGLLPVIADFGLAYLADDSTRLTTTHEAVGSRWYMAPELEAGRLDVVTMACDVYSLGKILYWLIAGRHVPRERHRDHGYCLFTELGSTDVRLVYEQLLDRAITDSPEGRPKDADELLALTRAVISDLNNRHRVYSLAGIEACSPRLGVYVSHFTDNGIIEWEPAPIHGSMHVHGFSCNYNSMCIWGVDADSAPPTLYMQCGDRVSNLRYHQVPIPGLVVKPAFRSRRPWRNIAFDSSNRAALTFTAGSSTNRRASDGFALSALVDEGGRRYRCERLATDVGPAMGGECAISNSNAIAVYQPASIATPGKPHGQPETVVWTRESIIRQRIGRGQTWPGPLEFDAGGALHQAIVDELPERPGRRALRYYYMTPSGTWSESIVVETTQLSAWIAMTIRDATIPVIVCEAPNARNAIAVFELVDGAWSSTVINVAAITLKYATNQFDIGSIMDARVDSGGNLHIVLVNELPMQLTSRQTRAGSLYLQLSPSLEVERHRLIPHSRFLGWGIGPEGSICLCLAFDSLT